MSSNSWIESDISGLEDYLFQDLQNATLDVEVSYNGQSLCSISGIISYNALDVVISTKDEDELSEMYNALNCVGGIPLQVSAITAKSFLKSKKLISDTDFEKWFNSQINNKRVFLDTNVMLNHLFSALELAKDVSLVNSTFEIPRLSILELERQANPKNKSKNSSSAVFQNGLKKRKALLAFGELLNLISKGSQPMPELPLDTLTSFSNISGDGNTDAWIRREIKDRKLFLTRMQVVTFPIFLTFDLVNSITAVAENIDTIYVSKIPNWEVNILKLNTKQVSTFIVLLSILFNEVSIVVNSKKSNLKGFWSGITTSDIVNKNIMVQAEN